MFLPVSYCSMVSCSVCFRAENTFHGDRTGQIYSGPVVLYSHKSEFLNFCTHEGTLCVSVLLYLLKCTSFQQSKLSMLLQDFMKQICNPNCIYFPKESFRLPHDCEMEKNIE